MKLHTYTNEILDIAKANGMSWDIGADMFLANIRNAGQEGLPYYKGAEGVKFDHLKAWVEELEQSKQKFAEAYRKHNTEIIALRKAGDREQIQAIMEAEIDS